MQTDQSENLISLGKGVFRESKGKIFIGGEEVKPEILSLLKEQAEYLKTSQLFEILNATVINESIRLAFESKDWDNVQYAKALKYWNTILGEMIKKLTK